MEKETQALCVQLVRLVDVAHHDLGLVGESHAGHAGGLFGLVDDPVPIADSLQSDRRTFEELPEGVPNGTPLMVHPGAPNDLAFGIEDGEEGKELVVVATDLVIRQVASRANTGGESATT